LWSNRGVFRLRLSDGDRRAYMNQRIKFRRRFTMQPNATMRPRSRVDKALMKSIGWRELTPESHRITNVATRDTATCFRRHYAITLHPETIRTRAFVFLFPVNGKMSAWCRLGWNPDTTGHRHQTAIALHHIDVFFRKRNFYYYLRWIARLVRSYMIRTAAADR